MFTIITPFNPFHIFNGAHIRARAVIDRMVSCYPTQVIYTGQDTPTGGLNITSLREKAEEAGFKFHIFESNKKLSTLSGLSGLDDIYFDDVEKDVLQVIASSKSSVLLVNYVFLTKIFETLSNKHDILKIVDTHDKLSREDVFRRANLPISFFCTSEQDEARGLRRADVILSIQKEEEDYFKKIAGSAQEVLTIGHLPKSFPPDGKNSIRISDKVTCGIVASGHVFNAESIFALLKEWKTLELGSRYELLVAGSVCDRVPEDLVVAGVTLLGKVPDLKIFYEKCDLLLLPVDFGTGLKIKTVEGLSTLKPLLGTREAFRGLPFLDSLGVVADSAECAKWLSQLSAEKIKTVMKQLENASYSRYQVYSREIENGYSRLFEMIGDRVDLPNNSRFFLLRHVVNFADIPITSDLYIAQPRAAKAMIDARKYFEIFGPGECSVELVSKLDPGEFNRGLPSYLDGFTIDNNVVTSHEFANLPKMRRLPTIASLLDLKDIDDEELIVYTNSDIVVQPYFYNYIYEIFSKLRLDSLVINRRTLDKSASVLISKISVSALVGEDHPGFDCFVIRGKLLKTFFFDSTLVGVHLIGRVILWNIFAHTENVKVIERSHLTYHFGDDNSSKDEAQSDFTAHNFDSACRVLDNLKNRFGNLWFNPLKKYVPAGVRMDYKPTVFKPAKDKPVVFFHGMFRVGSTYLFNKIRKGNPKAKVYYEPLHESLIHLSEAKIAAGDADTAKMHQRIESAATVWNEYLPLLQDRGGVTGYQLPFAYDDMTGFCNEINTEKAIYVGFLIEKALMEKRQPILQFNRTWLMTKPHILAKNYKVANYWIQRDPWSQFYSMWKTKNRNGGFLRTLLVIFWLNFKKLPLLKEAGLLQLSTIIDDIIGNFDRFSFVLVDKFSNQIVPKIDSDQYIRLFSYFWVISSLCMQKSRSKLIDINRLGLDLVYRREIEADLCKNYIYVNLDDCEIETYSDVNPSFRKDFEMIFNNVQSIIVDNANSVSFDIEHVDPVGIEKINRTTNSIRVERIGSMLYAINIGNSPIYYKHSDERANILLLPNSRRAVSVAADN